MRIALLVLLAACEQAPPPTSSSPSEAPAGPTVHQLNSDSDPGLIDDTLIAHIKSEHYEQAYNLMSTAYRDSVPLETFRNSVSRNTYLKTTQLIGCGETTTFEGNVHVRHCVLRSNAGSAHASLYYALEDAGWRMTGMLIGGTPAFPGPPADSRANSNHQ